MRHGVAEPLLQVGGQVDGGNDPEQGQVTRTQGVHVHQLMQWKPNHILEYLENSGVVKLGKLEIADSVLLDALGEGSMLTEGSQDANADWEGMWRHKLENGSRKASSSRGWNKAIEADAYVVAIKDAARPDRCGLIQPLLQRYQSGAASMSVFALPAVQAVIHFKWSRFARAMLIAELLLYLVWIGAFTVFVLLFQDEDYSTSFKEMTSQFRGIVEVAAECVALVFMIPFFLMDVATFASYGFLGWLNVWNVIDCLSYANQVVIVYCHVTRTAVGGELMTALVAVQYILLWFRLQYFFRVFRPTRTTFVETLRSVLSDVKWFLFFLVMTVWGFAVAFYTLFRKDQEEIPDFSNIGKSIVALFAIMAGGGGYKAFFKSHDPVTACVLYILFTFIMGVVLLNLLVAILTNSLDKVTSNAGLRLLINQAESIDELESTIPAWVEALYPKSWTPAYIHVLKVNPESIDRIKIDDMWTHMGPDMSLVDDGQDSSQRLKNLEQMLMAVAKKLGVQEAVEQPDGGEDTVELGMYGSQS